MCHPCLTGVDIEFHPRIERAWWRFPRRHLQRRPGVEMEALAASPRGADGLTNVQGRQRDMRITNIRLLENPAAGAVITERGMNMAKVLSVNISREKGGAEAPGSRDPLKARHGIAGGRTPGTGTGRSVFLAGERWTPCERTAHSAGAGILRRYINTWGSI